MPQMPGRAIPTWSTVAMPVSELVWPGPPVTSDSAGLRWIRAQASAACTAPDSCRMSRSEEKYAFASAAPVPVPWRAIVSALNSLTVRTHGGSAGGQGLGRVRFQVGAVPHDKILDQGREFAGDFVL